MAVLPAEGTTLEKKSAGTPGTFVEMAQVIRIGSTKKKVNPIKKTTLTSKFQKYRPGKIPDQGEVVFRIQYDPNLVQHQELHDDLDNGVESTWRIVYADGLETHASAEFLGFLLSIEEDDKEDEANVEADVTMQITDEVVRTPGTP